MIDHYEKRICRVHPMHIVLLADDSGSMGGDPAHQVTMGVRTWLTELQAFSDGGTRCYFYFSLIVFGSYAKPVLVFQDLNNVEPEDLTIEGKSGSTALGAALAEARRLLAGDGSTDQFCPPFVFVYSDGYADDPEHAVREAQSLKSLALKCGSPSIVTLGFGQVDDTLMRQVASKPELYKRTQDAQELARLLPAIGTPTAGRGGGPTVASFVRSMGESELEL
jgi:uncharacterized protein YegL